MFVKTYMKQQWSSSINFILAAAGSAIGLGNIWKFPKYAFEGGGGAYILVYLIIVAILGTAVLLAEFALGRATGENMLMAFPRGRAWIGYLGVATAFLVLCYYFQAGGRVLRYLWGYLSDAGGMFLGSEQVYLKMTGFCGFPFEGAVLFPLIYILLNAWIVQRGVQKGIERLSKIAMPVMIVLLVVLMVRALSMDGAARGVSFLLHIDFSTLGFDGLISALGQAFFSLSIGMSVMVTYGSMLCRKEPLFKNAVWVCALDTLTALMAGFILIPAVFAVGGSPNGGDSFAFVEITAVFVGMRGGAFFALLFYALLFFAAIVSSVSILAGVLCCIEDRWAISRGRATVWVCVLALALGVVYTAAWWGGWLEIITDRWLMPIVALLTCLYVGWEFDQKRLRLELSGNAKGFKLWGFLIRFVAPLAIVAILILSLWQ